MDDPVDGLSAPGPIEQAAAGTLDDHSTTLTSRKWVLREIEATRNLLLQHGGTARLPPELLAFATRQMGNEGWPRWVVNGIGMAFFRQWLREQLLPHETPQVVEPAESPASALAPKRARKR